MPIAVRDLVYIKVRACRLLAGGDHRKADSLYRWKARVVGVKETPHGRFAELSSLDLRYKDVPNELPTSYLTTTKWGRT